MDELIDILDTEGNQTGKSCLKSVAHKEGHYHATVHVWFYTNDGQVLLQQRGAAKKTYPSLWDVSVAGHVHAGESITDAALREVKEEIGISILSNDLQKIAIRKGERLHANGIKDNEFYHVLLVELKTQVSNLVKQDDEVDDLRLFDLEILKGTNEKFPVVPNTFDYYQFVTQNILSIIQ